MAKADQLLSDEKHQIYSKSYIMREATYLNLLMMLAKSGRFPALMLKILIGAPVVKVLNSDMLKPLVKHFYIGLKKSYHLIKKVANRA